uniref:Uncharacterized protein n=1 Tax=Sphaerodactylus townsendi TaxID=933632 RepID=A0ACB8FBS4_9SAUR
MKPIQLQMAGLKQVSSQIVITSPATSLANRADGVESKYLPKPTATLTGSKQQIALELSTAASTAHTCIGIDGTENSSSHSEPFSGANKGTAFAERLASPFSNTPKGNNADTERHHFCKIPWTKEQKGVQGEKESTGNCIT